MKQLGTQVAVSLYVVGDELDPNEVTSFFGTTPSLTRIKGQEWVGPSGRKTLPRTSSWSLELPLKSEPLNDQLIELTSRLSLRSGVQTLKGVEEAFVDIYVSAVADASGESKAAVDINPNAIQALGQLGLDVRVTVVAGPK